MRDGSLIKRALFSFFLGAGLSLALAGPSAALSFDDDDVLSLGRLPQLLDYAKDTATRESEARAWSTYQGSLRFTPCDDNGAFWACRTRINSSSVFDAANRDQAIATNNSVGSAERGVSAFNYIESTPQLNYSYFADITPATSSAKARTNFGSNQAQAAAWNSRTWTETRVQSAGDFTQSSITGVTYAGAAAWSTYTEVMTPDKDGQVIVQFKLEQHAGGGRPGFAGPANGDLVDGSGDGRLLVQVFDLDNIVDYYLKDRNDPVEGYALVGRGDVARDWQDTAGTSFLSLAFEVEAGKRYSLVSQLQVVAYDNASADFYGTASLERILVTPGMALAIGSGTSYAVMAVPEPETYALMLAGLALVGWAARRRERA